MKLSARDADALMLVMLLLILAMESARRISFHHKREAPTRFSMDDALAEASKQRTAHRSADKLIVSTIIA